jgi:hypothetical protein
MRIPFRALFLVLVLLVVSSAVSAQQPFLYAGDNSSGTLYKIDPLTGTTLTTIGVTMGGSPVNAIKGLAAHPGSGEIYAVVVQSPPPSTPEGNQPPVSSFRLAIIAPDTGTATEIGGLGDRFAGLAFAPAPSDGTPNESLVGVTGDGALNPEALFIIDTGDASTLLLMPLGNGDDGEAIAFNPIDGMLYHLSGLNFGQPTDGSVQVFEKIDLNTQVITPIALSGDIFVNGNGLTFDETEGHFLFSANGGQPGDGPGIYGLFSLTEGGQATALGLTDTFFGGTGFSNLVPVELMSFDIE